MFVVITIGQHLTTGLKTIGLFLEEAAHEAITFRQ